MGQWRLFVTNGAPIIIGVVDPASVFECALTASEVVDIQVSKVKGRFSIRQTDVEVQR